ncbi:MAG: protein kinase [Planctomycetes bacterium]|nr:protein kinase [Planctomycetota bacterium]
MGEENDLAIALMAKRQGLISQDQLTEALRLAGRTPGRQLVDIMVESGFLTAPQAHALLSSLGTDGSQVTRVARTSVGAEPVPPEEGGPPPAEEPAAGFAPVAASAVTRAVAPDFPLAPAADGPPPRSRNTPQRPLKALTPRRPVGGAAAAASGGRPSPKTRPKKLASPKPPGSGPPGRLGVDSAVAAGGTGRLGPYTLNRVIGSGGMGVVYEAVHDHLPRKVALKCLPTSLSSDPIAVDRFYREARAASKLNHPNLVPVFDVGQCGNTSYFAMEYIQGANLEELVERKELSIEDGARAIRDVALGLHFAHEQGILHRDVKPANIIRTPAGRVVLTDFGLSLELELPALTAAGLVVGTAAFMSPEQASGDRGALDARSDVYSLGATLFHLLVGRPPFQGSAFEAILAQVLFNDPPAPRTLSRRVPQDLETITLKAMEKEPERRYKSAQLLAEDLDRFLAGDAIQARPMSTVGHLLRRVKRHRRAFVLGSVVAVVALLGGAWAWREIAEAHRRVEAEQDSAKARADEQRKKEDAEKRLRDAEREGRSCAQLAMAMRAQDHAGAIKLLDDAIEKAPHLTELYLQRGRTHREVGDFAKAIKDFTTVIDKDKKAMEGYAERGVTYYLSNDMLRVQSDLLTVLALAPDHPFADVGRGCLAYVSGKRKEAVESLGKAILKDPQNAMAFAIRGAALVEMGQAEPGLKDLQRALELDANNVTALTSRAAWRFGQNQVVEALADSDQALRIFPASPFARQIRGLARNRLGRFAEAIEDLEMGLRLANLSPVAWSALAECDYFTGRLAQAEVAATHGLERKSEPRLCHFFRGLARADLLKLPEAAQDFEQVEKAGPGDAYSRVLRAAILLRRGEAAESHRAIHVGEVKGQEHTGERSIWYFVVHGRVLAADGRPDEALKEFQAVLNASASVEGLIKDDIAALRK